MIPSNIRGQARDLGLVAGVDTQLYPDGGTAQRCYVARVDTHHASLRIVAEAEAWDELDWREIERIVNRGG